MKTILNCVDLWWDAKGLWRDAKGLRFPLLGLSRFTKGNLKKSRYSKKNSDKGITFSLIM